MRRCVASLGIALAFLPLDVSVLQRQAIMRFARCITSLAATTCGKRLVLLVGLAWVFSSWHIDPARADDANARSEDHWRRTTAGWEYVASWDSPTFVERSDAGLLRWDSHPAGLALVQLLAVVMAFAVFPPLAARASRRSSREQSSLAV